MTLVRWDPIRDMMQLHRQLGRLDMGDQDAYGSWAPSVDIFEKGGDLILRAEVPGVEKDDIEINVEDNRLILSGERRLSEEFNEENTFRRETTYGRFLRSFQLPKTVDATKISASYKNGILEIALPKAEEAKPRKIEVQVA